MTPTQRSLKLLRDDGWYAEVTEHYNSFTRRRNDLLGFADILALKAGCAPALIQTTSGSNLAARRTKIEESELATLARQSGFVIILHGWRKLLVKRGGKAMRWVPKVEVVNDPD